jgi:aromatic-L-amino-acid decarboxylase
VEGLRHHVREHVAIAQEFASWVEADPDFELSAPVPLNLVCFRHRAGDETNQRVMDTVNDSGRMYLTHTKLDGNLVLRMSIGQTHTERRHVEAAWDAIRGAATSI